MVDKKTEGTKPKPQKKQGGTMIDTKTAIIKKEVTEKPAETPIISKIEEPIIKEPLKPVEKPISKEQVKAIYAMFPLRPNDLHKRHMFEQWFPQYDKALEALAATLKP